jgi:hypothetical protein
MRTSFITAFAFVLVASAASAGDAGEEVIRLGPPLDNDVFAGTSEWQAPMVTQADKGRHGNPAALAAEMAAQREVAILSAR